MNLSAKKKILGVTTAVAIMAGTLSPFVVQASPQNDNGDRPAFVQHHRFNKDQLAQNIFDTFGVDKQEVLQYEQNEVRPHDLFKAAFLAKAGQKSLKEVMQTKTFDNTWKDVAASLGISKEDMKAARNDIAATRLENKLQISKDTSLDLLQQGYRSRDIAVANSLANNTGKSISDILAAKKINNTWADVAASVGVDDAAFQQDMQTIHQALRPAGFHHGGSFMMRS